MAQDKIRVYLLSTFHFDGSTQDFLNPGTLDVEQPAIQAEIVQLVKQLQQLKPDKIFVEWPLSRQIYANETYAHYRANAFPLGTNEVYQIGYRLAAALNHQQLYCADAAGSWDYEALEEYARANTQLSILNSLYQANKSDPVARIIQSRTGVTNTLQDLSRLSGPLRQHLFALNGELADTLNMDNYLLGLTRLGEADQYPGADLVGEFYKRNVRIYTNVLRALDLKHDQVILLLIGQGHAAFIKSLLLYSSLFQVLDIRPFLLGV